MNELDAIIREVAEAQADGIFTTTEVVDYIVANNGGSREYLENKLRKHLRDRRLRGTVTPMKKRIDTAKGTMLVDAYKEKVR